MSAHGVRERTRERERERERERGGEREGERKRESERDTNTERSSVEGRFTSRQKAVECRRTKQIGYLPCDSCTVRALAYRLCAAGGCELRGEICQ